MLSTNRPNTQAHDGQVIVGIKNNLQNVSSLPLAASTYTMATLVQLVQSRIDAANTVVNARAHWVDASATYETLNTNVTKVVRALRQYVINVYGPDSPVLADFGFTATKRSPLTPEQLVAKAQKAAATRKARGTMGKKQKAKIKGTVVTTAPATPPSATAPAETPAAPPAVVVPAPVVTSPKP